MTDREFYDDLRKRMPELLQFWDQPGVALGVYKDGKVVFAEGFGCTDMETGQKPDADTLYQIGSSSKAFTATACAILADRGLLDFDTPIRQYLPWLSFADEYTAAHATVRDLLCHRTGLPRHDLFWVNSPFTRRELAEHMKYLQPVWPLRTKWCYQNNCYVALGCLIEELSGMSWEAFIQKEILDPLGMERTTYFVDAIEGDANHASPYNRPAGDMAHGIEKIPFLKMDAENMEQGIGAPFGPAGSLDSNINDMMKWVAFNLNQGKVGEKQLIRPETFAELHTPQMLMGGPLLLPCPEMDFYAYGMGWMMEKYRGVKMIDHGGNINGFSTLVAMTPELDLGIVVCVNFNNSLLVNALVCEITDHYLGIYDGDWHTRQRAFILELLASLPQVKETLRGPQTAGTAPSHALAAYAGVYEDPGYGKFTITLEDGTLYMDYNKMKAPLAHYHYDVFLISAGNGMAETDLDGFTVQFHTAKDGAVSALQITLCTEPGAKDILFEKTV